MYLTLARLEELLGIFSVVAELICDRKDLHAHGISAGFTCFLDHYVDDVVLAFEHNFQCTFDHGGALFHASGSPSGLCRSGFSNGISDILCVGANHFTCEFHRGGTAQL